MTFSSSGEVFGWLEKFINLERGQRPKSFRIDRMQFLCALTGNPEKCAPSIHVAGSKGKGSVTGMLTAMLTAAGFRTARYMSPHVVDIRERLCLGNSYFSEKIYCDAGKELLETVNKLQCTMRDANAAYQAALFDPEKPDGCEPTYWEMLTLFFFLCARKAKCDVIAAETGMGGRLDSTNILDPLVSVITLIELEHTGFLGSTIKAIAAEKAGIIKPGKPLVLAKQCDEALEVFKHTAKEKNSRLIYLPDVANLSDIKIKPDATIFTLNLPAAAPLKEIKISIPGKVQAENAALAITALTATFPQINEASIRKGLEDCRLPARFEKIASEPPFIIDGAHTPESLELCIETFCSLYGLTAQGGILIFGCAADKDAAAMARTVCTAACKTGGHTRPYFTKIFITTPGTFKQSNPSAVYEIFAREAGQEKVTLIADTEKAVRQAVEFAKENNLPILGTGSFYLVSEIRRILL